MNMSGSDSRPAAAPVDLAPAKLLLSITIPDIGVDIVVIQYPAIDWIVVHALAAWTINVAMRGEDGSTLSLGTCGTCCINLGEVRIRALRARLSSYLQSRHSASSTCRLGSCTPCQLQGVRYHSRNRCHWRKRGSSSCRTSPCTNPRLVLGVSAEFSSKRINTDAPACVPLGSKAS